MWASILKELGKVAVEHWTENLRQQQAAQQGALTQATHRQFIATLFQGDEAGAIARLKQQIFAFDDAQYGAFMQTVQQMTAEARQQLAQAQADGGNTAWGSSFEDRMALMMAEIKTGDRSSSNGVIVQAQQAVDAMARVAELAQQFRAESGGQPAANRIDANRQALFDALKPKMTQLAEQMETFKRVVGTVQSEAEAAVARVKDKASTPAKPRRPKPSKPAEPASAETPAIDIDALLDRFVQTGQMPDGLMDALKRADPATIERVTEKLTALGADQLGDRPLDNIADYYVEAEERYALLWPLGQDLPLPFDELDRKTQFHVLFAECRRVIMEASNQRNAGQLVEAAAGFREVLERADQIDVPILKCDAYQGLMTVEEKLGQRERAAHYLKLSERERLAQQQRLDAARTTPSNR